MHPEILSFLRSARVAAGVPADLHDLHVVEFGAFNANGSPREVFTGAASYVGVDWRPGPGVDVVSLAHEAPVQRADIAISCQQLEHDPHWQATVRKAADCVRLGGWLFLTWAGPGYVVHDVEVAPGGVHYCNLSTAEVEAVVRAELPDATIRTSYDRGTLDALLWARVPQVLGVREFVRACFRQHQQRIGLVLCLGDVPCVSDRDLRCVQVGQPWDGSLFDALLVGPGQPLDAMARACHLVQPGGLVLLPQVAPSERKALLAEAEGAAVALSGGVQLRGIRQGAQECLDATGYEYQLSTEPSTGHDAGPDGRVRVLEVLVPGRASVRVQAPSVDAAAGQALGLLGRRKLLGQG